MPFGRTHVRLLVDVLGLACSINSRCGRVLTMRTTHASLTHVVSERESMSQITGVKALRGRGILVLRGMSSKSSLGGAEGILVGDAVLSADMLQNLLINVEVRGGVGEPMLVANAAVGEVGLSLGGVGAAIAAVG